MIESGVGVVTDLRLDSLRPLKRRKTEREDQDLGDSFLSSSSLLVSSLPVGLREWLFSTYGIGEEKEKEKEKEKEEIERRDMEVEGEKSKKNEKEEKEEKLWRVKELEKGTIIEKQDFEREDLSIGRTVDVWPLAAPHPSLSSSSSSSSSSSPSSSSLSSSLYRNPPTLLSSSLKERGGFRAIEGTMERITIEESLWTQFKSRHPLPSRPSLSSSRTEMNGYFRDVGRWGESFIYDFLKERFAREKRERGESEKKRRKFDNGSFVGGVNIQWMNEETDSLLPYDMALSLSRGEKGEKGEEEREEEEEEEIEFIEVKTTRAEGKNKFPITSNEIEMANKMKGRYHLCVVWIPPPSPSRSSFSSSLSKQVEEHPIVWFVWGLGIAFRENVTPLFVEIKKDHFE